MGRGLALIVTLALLASGCASGRAPSPASQASPAPSAPGVDDTPEVPESPPASTDAPGFRGTVAAIDAATAARMTSSWRPGCPVPLRDLRLLGLRHWGFDEALHRGEMVVHRDQARGVVRVFRALFEAGFPIERMELVDEYGGDDDRSMAANNTSGFNCRSATGSPGVWSEHAYGRAIDINPVENPYVSSGGTVLPPAGAAYLDRSASAEGMIHDDDAVVRAFAAIGWTWGGTYTSVKDYQHFSATGR